MTPISEMSALLAFNIGIESGWFWTLLLTTYRSLLLLFLRTEIQMHAL